MHSGRLWIIMPRRQETIYNLIGNCDLKLGKAKEALNYYNLGLEQDDVSKKMKKEMNIISSLPMRRWKTGRARK